MEEYRTWDKKIKAAECHLNNAYNKTIADTPFYILNGHHPSFTDGMLRYSTGKEVKDD